MNVALPDDRASWWCPVGPCFTCGADVPSDGPAVIWAGLHGELILHRECAVKLGAHLIGDAREAELASGAQPWARRVARAAGSALRVLEPVR